MNFLRILLLLMICNISFAQQLEWAQHFGQSELQRIKGIAIDNEGNSYVIGETYAGTTDLDPGPGVFNLVHPGVQWTGYSDIFIVKLDPSGNFLWGKGLTTTLNSSNSAEGITIDPNGDIYTLMMTWNSTTSTNTIKKFDSNGNELMSRNIKNLNNAPNSNILSHSFDVDADANIYVTGYFYNTVTLDNSNPEFTLQTTGFGNYALKLNAAGEIVWAKEFLDNPSFDGAHKIKVRPDGDLNLLVATQQMNAEETGYDYGQILYKINQADCGIIWSKSLSKQMPLTFTIAPDGQIIIGSTFQNEVIDVDPSDAQHLITPDNVSVNMYFLWLSAEGEYIDVKPYYSVWQQPYVTDIEVDVDNNYYFTGYFAGDLDMDPGEGEFILSSTTEQDAMVIQLNPDRSFENAYKFGDGTSILITDIETSNGYVYLGGGYVEGVDFDPGPEELWLLSEYNGIIASDGYILKLGQCNTNAPDGQANQYFCGTSGATISALLPNSDTIAWYNSETSTAPLNANETLLDGNTYYAARIQNCASIAQRLAVTAHLTTTPTAPSALNQQFCSSQNSIISNLTATGADIKWYDSAVAGNLLAPTTALVNGQAYYASQTVNGCESPRTPVIVSLVSTPSVTATSPQTFCSQQNATVANLAITGTDIKVYDQLTGGNLFSAPTLLNNNQVYYCTQTLNGCESDVRIPITVNLTNTPAPTATATQNFCSSITPNISDLTVSGQNIQWYDAPTGGNLLPVGTLLGNMPYYASQTVDGCESAVRTMVNVVMNNSGFTASDYVAFLCDDADEGSMIIDLSIYDENLVTNPSDYDISYYTSLTGAQNEINTDEISDFKNFTVATGQTTIYVRIMLPGGCYKVAELKINLNPHLDLVTDEEYFLCGSGGVTVTASGSFDSYEWSAGGISGSITVTQPGNYWVKGIKHYGDALCVTTKNFIVNQLPSPEIISIDIKDWSAANNQVAVYATGDGIEFSIDGINFQSGNIFTGLEPGIYIVYVRNNCGLDKQQIVLLDYPRYFSPNGDGKNDLWNLDYAFFGSRVDIVIFDRFGKTLTKLNYHSIGWDGTYNNQPLPADDYWFVATRSDGKEYRGHFSLMR
ncbi:T9SS type B sorting domain-containing protein [Flavobacterium sp. DGU11]|uniref:T9SS type B sorting domain-containing protein n=1 Tax=Flavobacterium arundinis TaxID=3139143 RepID=A0ABU9HW77_9FLAO